MNWLPIETYDKLKKKPRYAVFWVAAKPPNNEYQPQTALREMVCLERHFGSRDVTHWMPLEEPK